MDTKKKNHYSGTHACQKLIWQIVLISHQTVTIAVSEMADSPVEIFWGEEKKKNQELKKKWGLSTLEIIMRLVIIKLRYERFAAPQLKSMSVDFVLMDS